MYSVHCMAYILLYSSERHVRCRYGERKERKRRKKRNRVQLITCTDIRLHTRRKVKQNAAKGWLSNGEAEVVMSMHLKCMTGFPMSHKQLKEHVDKYAKSNMEQRFPGVAKNWTEHLSISTQANWQHIGLLLLEHTPQAHSQSHNTHFMELLYLATHTQVQYGWLNVCGLWMRQACEHRGPS